MFAFQVGDHVLVNINFDARKPANWIAGVVEGRSIENGVKYYSVRVKKDLVVSVPEKIVKEDDSK